MRALPSTVRLEGRTIMDGSSGEPLVDLLRAFRNRERQYEGHTLTGAEMDDVCREIVRRWNPAEGQVVVSADMWQRIMDVVESAGSCCGCGCCCGSDHSEERALYEEMEGIVVS